MTQKPLEGKDGILASVPRRQPPYEAQAEALIAAAQLQKLNARPASDLGAYETLKKRLLQHKANTGEQALVTTSPKTGYETAIFFDPFQGPDCIRIETGGVNEKGLTEFFEREIHPPESGISYTAKVIGRATKHVPVFEKPWQVKRVDELADEGTIPPHLRGDWTSIEYARYANAGVQHPDQREYFRHIFVDHRDLNDSSKIVLNPKDPKDPLSLNVTA